MVYKLGRCASHPKAPAPGNAVCKGAAYHGPDTDTDSKGASNYTDIKRTLIQSNRLGNDSKSSLEESGSSSAGNCAPSDKDSGSGRGGAKHRPN